jgi:hypothetical protein
MTNLNYKVIGVLIASLCFAGCGDDDDGGGTPDAQTGGADAAMARTFTVTLTKAAEIPSACAMAGADATGSGTVTVSADRSTITVMLTYSGLSGAATMGHLHCGTPTQAGGVAIGFTSVTSPINLTLTAANYATTPGMLCPATFAEYVNDILNGKAYANIHTTACTGGEIRGNLQ